MESSKTLQRPPDIPINTRFTFGEMATQVMGDGRPSSSSSWISNIFTYLLKIWPPPDCSTGRSHMLITPFRDTRIIFFPSMVMAPEEIQVSAMMSRARSLREIMSVISTVPSFEMLRSSFPSPEKQMLVRFPGRVYDETSVAFRASQIVTLPTKPSEEPVAMRLPSGEYATASMGPLHLMVWTHGSPSWVLFMYLNHATSTSTSPTILAASDATEEASGMFEACWITSSECDWNTT
mmetsp:Transcript_3502/g.7933  ORF Transcript_3502/g.7933 Transcript_3502/m.7933 type:complete len:236 (-) Transcript_3502:457-1164(-)